MYAIARIPALGAITFGLAACTSAGPTPVPIHTIKVAGGYQAVSDCALRALAAQWPGVSKDNLDSQKMVEIRTQGGDVTSWVIEFHEAGPDATRIGFRTFQTIYGPDFWGEKLYSQFQSCGRRLG